MLNAIKKWEDLNKQQIEYIKVIKGDIESLKESYNIAHNYNNIADKEIERLNNIIETYKDANEYHQNKIEELEKALRKSPNQLHSENVMIRRENKRLHSIIKEVREYITGVYDSLENVDRPIKLYEDILEILDKESEVN